MGSFVVLTYFIAFREMPRCYSLLRLNSETKMARYTYLQLTDQGQKQTY